MADSQAAGSGLPLDKGRTQESGGGVCGSRIQEPFPFFHGLQEAIWYSAYGTGTSTFDLSFSEMKFEPHRNASVGLLRYFCLRRNIETCRNG